MKEIYLISSTCNYWMVNDFLVLCNFSWLHPFFLRYDVAIFDLLCLLLCIFGSVHLVVLVPDIRSFAVQLSLCSAGYFHRRTLDWTLFIPVPILSRSSSTQWLLCKVREIFKTFQEEVTSFTILFEFAGILLDVLNKKLVGWESSILNLLNDTV